MENIFNNSTVQIDLMQPPWKHSVQVQEIVGLQVPTAKPKTTTLVFPGTAPFVAPPLKRRREGGASEQ